LGDFTWDFNNGWIIIPLEQMAGRSPSAADRKAANGRETDSNSFAVKELNWREKTASRQFL
jgi:hypothetical protein